MKDAIRDLLALGFNAVEITDEPFQDLIRKLDQLDREGVCPKESHESSFSTSKQN